MVNNKNVKANSGRLILKKSSISDTYGEQKGLVLNSAFVFAEILLSSEDSEFKPGDIVCVNKNALADIPFDGTLNSLIFETKVEYVIKQKSTLRDTSI